MLAGTVSQKQVIIEDRTREFHFFLFHMSLFLFFLVWCLGKRFDTNYPEELRGIIDPSEFDQSIYNINLSRRKTFFELIVSTIIKLILLAGLIVMFVGFALIATGNTTVVVIVAVIGFVITIVTMLIFGLINSLWITPAYKARLKKAVHDESMNYATQSTPTRWRLDVRYTSHVTTYVNYMNYVPIGTSQRTSILGPYYSVSTIILTNRVFSEV